MDELVAEANLALATAAAKFDPALGYRFSTYATSKIRFHLMNVTGRDLSRDPVEEPESPVPAKAAASEYEVSEELTKVLGGLTVREREVLLRRVGYEDSLKTVSGLTGLSIEGVRKAQERGWAKVREAALRE